MRTSWLGSLLGCGFALLVLGALAGSGERFPVERAVTEAFRSTRARRRDAIDGDELLHWVGPAEDHRDFLEVGAGHLPFLPMWCFASERPALATGARSAIADGFSP